MGAVSAAVGDLPELLDVEVDHVAGTGVLVALGAGARGADGLSGQRVAGRQWWHVLAVQDAADGAGRHPGVVGQALGSASQFAAGGEHPLFHVGGCATRALVRAAAAVVESGPALGPVAVDPAMSTLPRDPHLLRHVRDRPPVEDDTTHEQASAVKGQPGISVGHQDLRGE